MALKELQNNFTTPEQSKRLLELGVPADSADCIWYNPYYDGNDDELAEISVWKGKYPQRIDKYTLPCWSVGRLIEIFNICAHGYFSYIKITYNIPLLEQVLLRYEDEAKKAGFNFSKLEE